MSEDEERKARRRAWCEANKEKIAAYQKAYREAYREANKEKVAASQKAYCEANPEKVKAHQKAYREANKEKVAASQKAWTEANKEKRAASQKAYYEANKEELAARQKAYRGANKENVKRRRKKWMAWLQAHDPRITQPALHKWSWLVRERDDFTCQECGVKENLHAHHMIPIKICPEKALDLDNGTTFCAPCHYDWHSQNPTSSF